MYPTGQEVANEAKSKAAVVLLAPTLNIIRHPLGGRNYETYSEDPVVLGILSAEYVKGCQSEGIAATPKHFVANEAENFRTKLSVELDKQTLREIYLLPFQLVMKLSNRDDRRLIEDVLRREWGFKGAVISDWMGVYSTADSINAGVDMELPGPPKWRGKKLVKAVEDGLVTEETVKEFAVESIERDNFIKYSAAKGMVVLKNEGNVLPIPKSASVAMIGRHAFHPSLGGGGSARVDSIHAISPVEGLKSAGFSVSECPGIPVFGAVPHADPSLIFASTTKAQSSRPVKLEWLNGSAIGENLVHKEMVEFPEYMIKEKWSDYLDKQYCTRMKFELVPPTSGEHLLSVVSTGRAVCYINGKQVFEREQERALHPESFYFFKSKLERRFEHYMEAGQSYEMVLEAWNTDPELLKADHLKDRMFQGAALRFHEHIDLGGRLEQARKAAKACDYAVVCVGTTVEIESEGFDRTTMDLSPLQYQQIAEVAAQNPRTIVVNFSGGPTNVSPFVDTASGIVQAWFPGQECGHSLAAVLSGEVNPSGRLPFSWPKRNEDNPAFNNFPCDDSLVLKYEEGLDVGYRYYDRTSAPEPLFPFGFGLSYTTFDLSHVNIGKTSFDGIEDRVEVSCEVKNVGDRDGDVVVQYYVSMPEAGWGLDRPLKELRDFQKISLKAGQTARVLSVLDKYAFSFYNSDRASWQANAGTYEIQAGFSAQDIRGSAKLQLESGFTWTGV